jgi:ketosteroid isomerase-like protein
MSSDADRVAVVERGWRAFESGDEKAVLAFLDPEIEIYSPPEVGNPGTFRGHAGWMQWVTHWFEAWGEFRQELLGIEPIGDRSVVSEVRQTARGRSAGIELERTVAYVYEVRGAKAVYLGLQPDLEAARAPALEREARGAGGPTD